MDKIFVTTFNKKLYDRYAHKLIESYLNTEQKINLTCCVEDNTSFYPNNKKNKIPKLI
mgnify:FL=1